MMRGDDVWTHDISGRRNPRGGIRISRALPSRVGRVHVRLLDGRGSAHVIQQPSARNGYTAVVRVRDDDRRADRYRVVAYWQPVGRGGWDDRGDWDDRGRWGGRDRNGTGYGYGDGRLRWSGAVDDQIEIRIQGRSVSTRTLSGNGARDVRSDLDGRPLPRRDLQIRVRERQGRGTVTVVQQPGQWNGYTAVIRVRDRQGGFGYYDFDVVW
jgi:hypothetical protein